MKSKAAIYVRVSTIEQVKKGYSIAAQKSNLTEFCYKQNWDIFDIYADEGISGKNISKRPGILKLISDIEKFEINIVLLYKFDRLTRDVKDTESIINLLEKYNVTVYTISGGLVDISSATGKFMIRMNGAIAQLEREQTIERIKVAFKEKAKEGYSLCSKCPSYGYNRFKGIKNLTINKKESLIVKKIYQMYLDNYFLIDIAKYLNKLKIPTKLNNKWTSKNIKLILTNPVYIGKIKCRNEYFDGLHQSIIENEMFKKAQEKILKEKINSKTKHPYQDAVFSRILYCANCGNRLAVKRVVKNKTYLNYRCPKKEAHLCTMPSISEKKLEKSLINYIESKKIKAIKNENHFNKINQIKKQEIMQMYLDGEINKEEFIFLSKEIIKKEPRKPQDKNIFKNWYQKNKAQKYKIIHEYISKMIVDSCNKDIIIDITFQ